MVLLVLHLTGNKGHTVKVLNGHTETTLKTALPLSITFRPAAKLPTPANHCWHLPHDPSLRTQFVPAGQEEQRWLLLLRYRKPCWHAGWITLLQTAPKYSAVCCAHGLPLCSAQEGSALHRQLRRRAAVGAQVGGAVPRDAVHLEDVGRCLPRGRHLQHHQLRQGLGLGFGFTLLPRTAASHAERHASRLSSLRPAPCLGARSAGSSCTSTRTLHKAFCT